MNVLLPDTRGQASDVRVQLERILASKGFAHAERMSRFLRFTVEYTLENRAAELKEYVIGVEVFDRTGNYDPRLDPVVRVEARRLRSKLAGYYEDEGKADVLLIDFPKGTYVPAFRNRSEIADVPATPQNLSTIAVLPFANLSPDCENDYFSDGLTQELIHLLTKVEGLRVVAWNTSSQLKGKTPDPYSIGQQLKVGSLLTGSIRGTNDKLRITAQLVNTKDGHYLWSETYDREMKDVFAIQEEISVAIVKTLSDKLTCQAPMRSSGSNLEAYNLYLKGRFHWNKRTDTGLHRSIQFYSDAIALDQNFAMAYSGLADSYSLLADYGYVHPSVGMPKAKAAAEKALELDPMLGEAETSLGLIRGVYEWRWQEAERHYRRAISLSPGYSTAHHWFAIDYLCLMGRFAEAVAEMEIACELDPLSPIIREGIGFLAMLDGRHDEAIGHYKEVLELDPYFYKGFTSMGRAYIQKGMYEEAIVQLQRGRALAGEVPNILGALGQAFGLGGRVKDARRTLDELTQLSETRFVPCTSLALVHLGLGEKAQALEILEEGCNQRQIVLQSLMVHPAYSDLRGEPRFTAILRKIGLLPR
ncbi:MAG: tetratricopeptide repeat protein [Bryobacteraceae bacterium]